MATLLLRLAGPMQSWGTRSRWTDRDTEREPSKSGVVGLLCSALGIRRWEPADWLAELEMGVRVDFEGTLRTDYHTAGARYPGGIAIVGGGRKRDAVVSHRHYLADADFLVALGSDDRGLLERLDRALREPRWQLSLGRKSFVPGVPVAMPKTGIREMGVREVLGREPWPGWGKAVPRRRDDRLRLVLEAGTESNEVRTDRPVGPAYAARAFALRHVQTLFHPLGEGGIPLRHDPWEV